MIKVLLENADKARALVKRVAPMLATRNAPCVEGCHTALDMAMITAPEARDPAEVRKLDAVAGRVLKPKS